MRANNVRMIHFESQTAICMSSAETTRKSLSSIGGPVRDLSGSWPLKHSSRLFPRPPWSHRLNSKLAYLAANKHLVNLDARSSKLTGIVLRRKSSVVLER